MVVFDDIVQGSLQLIASFSVGIVVVTIGDLSHQVHARQSKQEKGRKCFLHKKVCFKLGDKNKDYFVYKVWDEVTNTQKESGKTLPLS